VPVGAEDALETVAVTETRLVGEVAAAEAVAVVVVAEVPVEETKSNPYCVDAVE
jgi:hypothetical protein